jgi:hypothetical protein
LPVVGGDRFARSLRVPLQRHSRILGRVWGKGRSRRPVRPVQ